MSAPAALNPPPPPPPPPPNANLSLGVYADGYRPRGRGNVSTKVPVKIFLVQYKKSVLRFERHVLILVEGVFHPFGGPNNFFWGPKYCKISLEKHPFAYFFKFHLCVLYLTTWNTLGTLVVIDNDARDHL